MATVRKGIPVDLCGLVRRLEIEADFFKQHGDEQRAEQMQAFIELLINIDTAASTAVAAAIKCMQATVRKPHQAI